MVGTFNLSMKKLFQCQKFYKFNHLKILDHAQVHAQAQAHA